MYNSSKFIRSALKKKISNFLGRANKGFIIADSKLENHVSGARDRSGCLEVDKTDILFIIYLMIDKEDEYANFEKIADEVLDDIDYYD